MSTKKRILFCTESSNIKSGYGNYTRSILERLFATNKYEIAELSCYHTTDLPKNKPWKIYPNAVGKNDPRFPQYNSSISNSFGQWRFDIVAAHFKPDVVIDFRDIFMTTFERTSVFRNKFHWILAPTIDSFPIRQEWVDLIKNCDTLLTHTKWAMDKIYELYKIKAKGVVRDSIDTSNFRPLNKISCRNELGLPIDAFLIGSVMRNQKRKLIPDLFRILSELNHKDALSSIYLYMHTSYPESMGWDIPDLLLEHQIFDFVFFTYVCKKCGHWKPMRWKGPVTTCNKCSEKKMSLASVSNGIQDKDLCKIYNTFDIYLQYAVCEGFGIPPLESAACGVPFMTVDHGAMSELADDIGGYKVPVSCIFRDQDNNSDRVYPNNTKCVDMLQKYMCLSLSEKLSISEKSLKLLKEQHSWDYTAKEFERIIDDIADQDDSRWKSIEDSHFEAINKSVGKIENNRDFVYAIIDNILEEPALKSSFFVQQLIMALDNGYILSDKTVVPYGKQDAGKILEVLFNNKVMLNKFLDDTSIIKQDDFLNY